MKTRFQKIHTLIPLLLSSAICGLTAEAQENPAPQPAAAVPAAPEEAPDAEAFINELQKILEELSDDNFRTREAATIKLWKIGDKAEPFIREAVANGDLELRTRAARLLGLFKYGIYPDTPPEIVDLINQFRHGNLNEQTNAIQQLYSRGENGVVAKLIRSVEDPSTRRRLVSAVVEELDEKLAELFAAEKYDSVEELLTLAAISDEGLRDLAAFHFQHGTIDEKIKELLDRDKQEGELTPIEYEQLAWFYRMKSDLDAALVAATASGNAELEREIRIAQGDLLALIKASYNPNDRTIQAYGFTAASQRLSGDTEGFEATVTTIKKYAQANPGEVDQCVSALLINGRINDAIEIAEEGSVDRIQLLIDNGDLEQALAELGVTKLKPPYDDWLASLTDEFAKAETSSENGKALGRAYSLARLLQGWGETAEAERIFDRLGQTAAKKKPDFMPRFIANASVLGLHEIALKYTRDSFVKEAADADAIPEIEGIDAEEERVRNRTGQSDAEASLLSALYYNESSTASFIWERCTAIFPDEKSLERLKHLEALIAPPAEGADEEAHKSAALALLEKLMPEKDEEMENDDRVALLANLAELYLRHEDRSTAMEVLRKSLELERDDAVYAKVAYGEMLASEGKWKEASEYLKAAAEGLSTNPYYLVRYAIALERSGEAKDAANLIKRARLQALGRPIEYMRIAAAFAGFGEYERARESSQIALNIATLDDASIHREALRLADYVFYEDANRSAMYKERYLIECLKGHVSLPRITSASSIRGSIASLQARIALEDNRSDDAVKILRDVIRKQPSNSSIVEDLYPLLVKAGRQKEAEEFYENLNGYGEHVLGIFPKSAQDLNSNAWLKSRCGKDLDTALKRSELSNELSKQNSAYIDTLAEVHFQRGDREKAVELSEEAVKMSGRDFLLDHQLNRFKNAKPLSELLAE